MGQAKLRGTFEERKLAAIQRKQAVAPSPAATEPKILAVPPAPPKLVRKNPGMLAAIAGAIAMGFGGKK